MSLKIWDIVSNRDSNNPKGRVLRSLPVGEWEHVRRASSEARKVEAGAAASASRVSTPFKILTYCFILEVEDRNYFCGTGLKAKVS